MEANVSLAFMATVVWYRGKSAGPGVRPCVLGEGACSGTLVSVL